MQPTPVFLPGKSHGQRSPAGYSHWSCIRVGYDLVPKQQHKCFTTFCQILLHNNVNQPYIDLYPIPLEPPSHPLNICFTKTWQTMRVLKPLHYGIQSCFFLFFCMRKRVGDEECFRMMAELGLGSMQLNGQDMSASGPGSRQALLLLGGQSTDGPAGSTRGLSPGWAAFLGLRTDQTPSGHQGPSSRQRGRKQRGLISCREADVQGFPGGTSERTCLSLQEI